MPPRDPRLCPALERALPGDSGIFDGYREDRSPWLILFGDDGWHPVTVRAWWRDRRGREVVRVEFHGAGSTYGESYLFDPKRMRETGGHAQGTHPPFSSS